MNNPDNWDTDGVVMPFAFASAADAKLAEVWLNARHAEIARLRAANAELRALLSMSVMWMCKAGVDGAYRSTCAPGAWQQIDAQARAALANVTP